MPIYRVIAAVNTAPGHYDGYQPGDPLACVTARAGGNPIVFAIDAESTATVLEEMWVLGNRVRDDRQGRCWPSDVRSLSTGDVPDRLSARPPPSACGGVRGRAVLASTPSAAPTRSSLVALEGSNATSRPAPSQSVPESHGPARDAL